MSIILGEKNLISGNKSLYLDINYQGKRKKEYLNIILKKPTNTEIRKENKEKRLLADEIRAKRELELISKEYEVTDRSKKNIDFLIFFEDYTTTYENADYRLINACYKKFIQFIKERSIKSLPIKLIDKELCENFQKFLENLLNGESPYDYFKKFRSVLQKAVDSGYILKNPSKNIKNKRVLGLKKSILFPDEIQQLASTPINNPEIKKAFLFSINTGLRLCDVKKLKWNQIANDKVTYIQEKVKRSSAQAQVIVDLNENARILIGERKEPNDLIFNLPTTTNGCNKVLKNWVKSAGIEKKITWHCARHSLAVNLLRPDVGNSDIKTVAGILGHASIRSTEIYTHLVNELMKKAVNSLPKINL